jgi:neutral ceramidase
MGQLEVGSAQVDITPGLGCHIAGYFEDRLAQHIHDPLYAKALVVCNGQNCIALVTVDLVYIDSEQVEQAKAMIAAQNGIAPHCVMISATHTHTGPAVRSVLGTPAEPGYGETLPKKIADAVQMAYQQRCPAEFAHTSGSCPEEVHNRRWHMKDGSVRMNPGYRNPDAIRPAGPTDPELGLMIFREKGSRKPLAVYANYPLHYVGNSQHCWISADYFGEYAAALQRIAGDKFMVIMANGCQGNINNCDFTRPARTQNDPYHKQRRVANVIAAETWKQWSLLRESDYMEQATLVGTLKMLPFVRRRASDEELAKAERLVAANDRSNGMEWIYAQELVKLEQDMPLSWDVPLQAIRIGDLGIVGLHGEVFVEIGLAIKEQSPFARSMVIGMANGSSGYIPTDQALSEGSYETRLCRHVCAPAGTADAWIAAAAEALAELKAI